MPESIVAIEAVAPQLAPTPARGIDHLAFVTDDLPATMDFYTRVMQMQLVHVRRVPFERDRGQPPYDNLRHYFFNMGNDTLLAFFEYPKGLGRQNRDLPGGMQHIAFHVPRERLDQMVEHVQSCGVSVIGPVPLGGRFWSAYFYDNNGIRLELATSLADESLCRIGPANRRRGARGTADSVRGPSGCRRLASENATEVQVRRDPARP